MSAKEVREERQIFSLIDTRDEIPQCPRCKLYTDEPEHYCGSVAVVSYWDGPIFWSDFFIVNQIEHKRSFSLEENRNHWTRMTSDLMNREGWYGSFSSRYA